MFYEIYYIMLLVGDIQYEIISILIFLIRTINLLEKIVLSVVILVEIHNCIQYLRDVNHDLCLLDYSFQRLYLTQVYRDI